MEMLSFILSFFVSTSVSVLEPTEYSELMEKSDHHILLDIRMYEKYMVERIPGASWAGERQVLDSIVDQLDKSTDIFIYCSYGDRTREVIRILKRKRFRSIYDLEKGFEQWFMESFPIDNEIIEISNE